MRALSLSLVAGLCLVLSACGSSKPKDLIIGKWECTSDKDKGMVAEFNKDGTASMGMGPISLKAKYKFLDDNTVEMEMENPFGPGGLEVEGAKVETKGSGKQTVKVAVSKDELTLTDQKGDVAKFKPAK